MWTKKGSKYVFQNRWLKVRQDDLDVSGKIYDYYVVELADDVVVAALNEKKEILFVKSYRVAVEEMLLELPAGFVEKGKSPDSSALSELEEETGYNAGKIEKIGEMYRSPSKLTHKTHLYLATDLEWIGQSLEHDEEHIEIVTMKLDDALKLVDDGKILETAIINCLLLIKRRGIV